MKKISYDWCFADYPKEKNGLKVFSTFACGGGSTMGYKLVGYEVLGCVEIDKPIFEMYKKNHNPKYAFNCDIRDFIKLNNLPEELYNLDILDGSPPCSSFSIAGNREDDWGKKKVFREGQAHQTLDDLFFEFIKLTDKLKPKVAVAENVKGLLSGNAKGYVKEIVSKFNKIGYDVQVFLLNGATMGLPQKRERVFFIAKRKDLNFPKLKINFKERPITFGEIKESNPITRPLTSTNINLMKNAIYKKDKTYADINLRLYNKTSGFTKPIFYDDIVSPTLTATTMEHCAYFEKQGKFRRISYNEWLRISSFPRDYNFENQLPTYVMGMSVPPLMMYKLSQQIYLQLFKQS